MGFRFRRRIKILPGVYLNIGKRGVSASVGVNGAHVTVGEDGTRTTVGAPGTGLSYTHLERKHHADELNEVAATDSMPPSAARGYLWAALILIVMAAIVFRSLP
ncbi:MAG: hypothetical protein NVS9B10_03580 [Nevskia sp.]